MFRPDIVDSSTEAVSAARSILPVGTTEKRGEASAALLSEYFSLSLRPSEAGVYFDVVLFVVEAVVGTEGNGVGTPRWLYADSRGAVEVALRGAVDLEGVVVQREAHHQGAGPVKAPLITTLWVGRGSGRLGLDAGLAHFVEEASVEAFECAGVRS